ncbi:kinase-like domain, phloem protein 2-like protein [Tanacetum coccineum]|uniref:Kinase-like domain, phloem protein 2-like protein n=1 Tax=Tanacetum coccineum TaxID=301880 RepID=A0ABQ5BKX7_9ASTR
MKKDNDEKIYRRLDSCLVIPPPKGKKPKAIIKFLGGAFIRAVPEVTCGYLLGLLANEGYLIIYVPYNVTFDHSQAAREVFERFHFCLNSVLTYGLPSDGLLAAELVDLPLYSVGHSNGTLLQVLSGSYFSDKLPKANAIISYNNRPATEAVVIVMKMNSKHVYILHGETKVFIVYDADKREDGWFVAPLYQFTSDHKTVDLEIIFERVLKPLQVGGIELQPLEEKVRHYQVLGYQDIVKASSQALFYKSLEELKVLLSIGVRLNGHKRWFSLNENGQHCEMISIFDYKRHKDYYVAELYQFTSYGKIVDLEIVFSDHQNCLEVEGILFQPLVKVEHDRVLEDKKMNTQILSDLEILNLPNDSVQWTMKKNHYSNLLKTFHITKSQECFSGVKTGKKCLMLSPRGVIRNPAPSFKPFPESRFRESAVIKTHSSVFEIVNEIKFDVVSPETSYAVYLVYRLPQDQSIFEAPLEIVNCNGRNSAYPYVYFVSPLDAPVISEMLDQIPHNPVDRPKLNAVPQQRSDSWMEVKIWEFQTPANTNTISMHLWVKHPRYKDLSGLIIQCVELRPT